MSTPDFFRSRLDAMIDMRHPLAVLANRMPWTSIEATSAHDTRTIAARHREKVIERIRRATGVLEHLACGCLAYLPPAGEG